VVTLACSLRAQDPLPPPYGGELLGRTALTGDWGGVRDGLAEKGIKLTLNMTQTIQGIASGGRRHDTDYYASLDYQLDLDTDAAGLWPGGFLKFRAETGFGDNLSGDSGLELVSANADSNFPVANVDHTVITDLQYTQFLSDNVAVFFGRLNTTGGDMNAFAHGLGRTQFLNTNLTTNVTTFQIFPYVTTAVGARFFFGPDSVLSLTVLDSDSSPTRTGHDTMFTGGTTFSAETRLAVSFGDLPGHQLFGGAWSSKEYLSTEQDPRILFGGLEVDPVTKEGSWVAYYNFDQFVLVEEEDATQGVGIFGRLGISDGNPNPIEWTLNVGIGGKGVIPGRDQDTFGLGYFHGEVSGTLQDQLPLDASYGFEAFYNAALTPSAHLTVDFQVVEPASTSDRGGEPISSPVWLLGVRLHVDF